MLNGMLRQVGSEMVIKWYRMGRKWLVGLTALCVLASVGCGGGGGGGGSSSPPSDILHQIDGNADGDIDMTWTYKHNSAGQITSLTAQEGALMVGTIEYEHDASGDCGQAQLFELGVLDTTVHFTYNADGEVTLAEVDEGSDSTIDGCTESMYNADGLLDRREDDSGCDGSVERYKTFGWNAAGNLLWMEKHDSGVTDREDYAYDAEGNLSTITYDDGDDGSIESVDTVTWAAGAVGTENYINVQHQDYGYFHPERRLAPYRMVRHLAFIETDTGNDGTIDSMLYFYYGADGRLARFETDEDNNAVMDHIEHFTW